MTETKLKTCPHCGGEADLCSNYDSYKKKYFVKCKCEICGSAGKVYVSYEDPSTVEWNNIACIKAVDAWNMRVNNEG